MGLVARTAHAQTGGGEGTCPLRKLPSAKCLRTPMPAQEHTTKAPTWEPGAGPQGRARWSLSFQGHSWGCPEAHSCPGLPPWVVHQTTGSRFTGSYLLP